MKDDMDNPKPNAKEIRLTINKIDLKCLKKLFEAYSIEYCLEDKKIKEDLDEILEFIIHNQEICSVLTNINKVAKNKVAFRFLLNYFTVKHDISFEKGIKTAYRRCVYMYLKDRNDFKYFTENICKIILPSKRWIERMDYALSKFESDIFKEKDTQFEETVNEYLKQHEHRGGYVKLLREDWNDSCYILIRLQDHDNDCDVVRNKEIKSMNIVAPVADINIIYNPERHSVTVCADSLKTCKAIHRQFAKVYFGRDNLSDVPLLMTYNLEKMKTQLIEHKEIKFITDGGRVDHIYPISMKYRINEDSTIEIVLNKLKEYRPKSITSEDKHDENKMMMYNKLSSIHHLELLKPSTTHVINIGLLIIYNQNDALKKSVCHINESGVLQCGEDILQDLQEVLYQSDYADTGKQELRMLLQQILSELNGSYEDFLLISSSQISSLQKSSIDIVLDARIMRKYDEKVTKLKCKYCYNYHNYECDGKTKIMLCDDGGDYPSYKLTAEDLKLYEISLRSLGEHLFSKNILNSDREVVYSNDLVYLQGCKIEDGEQKPISIDVYLSRDNNEKKQFIRNIITKETYNTDAINLIITLGDIKVLKADYKMCKDILLENNDSESTRETPGSTKIQDKEKCNKSKKYTREYIQAIISKMKFVQLEKIVELDGGRIKLDLNKIMKELKSNSAYYHLKDIRELCVHIFQDHKSKTKAELTASEVLDKIPLQIRKEVKFGVKENIDGKERYSMPNLSTVSKWVKPYRNKK